MNEIAVIITCFNRKQKTLACLKHLYSALNNYNTGKLNNEQNSISIYLTDDGCTDGTADAVRTSFPDCKIKILLGDGNLYWAGGMCFAWKEALKGNFDWYLLLNDDTYVYENLFDLLFEVDAFTLKTYEKRGISVGFTADVDNPTIMTYGGEIIKRGFFLSSQALKPSGVPQLCDLANANIMLIPKSTIDKIGIFYDKYIHGPSDHDYSHKARKNGIPVVLTSQFAGKCKYNNNLKLGIDYVKMSFTERKIHLNNPVGEYMFDKLLYEKRNRPLRYPVVYCGYLLKLYIPFIYYLLDKIRKTKI